MSNAFHDLRTLLMFFDVSVYCGGMGTDCNKNCEEKKLHWQCNCKFNVKTTLACIN